MKREVEMSKRADAYKKRKIHFIKKDFQFRFILKFCLVILAGVTISTGLFSFFLRVLSHLPFRIHDWS